METGNDVHQKVPTPEQKRVLSAAIAVYVRRRRKIQLIRQAENRSRQDRWKMAGRIEDLEPHNNRGVRQASW